MNPRAVHLRPAPRPAAHRLPQADARRPAPPARHDLHWLTACALAGVVAVALFALALLGLWAGVATLIAGSVGVCLASRSTWRRAEATAPGAA